ncbi:hypothetical protein CCM_08416 [Cordyceps militaris CM01]|uniref:Uncharacterized protein n=1 Tax=Cordyceps militaris (strain CM01) TaxID=983644 RepID=G3JR77_CORMM|nr:uncharacterized protein CCM_08416 [Cordyceps militaris CM01]EGX88373.1 hypothetical protein CCM_08416 [Cordyceps militaris CM01]
MALHQRSRGAWHHWAPSKKRPVLAKIFNHSPDNADKGLLAPNVEGGRETAEGEAWVTCVS